MIKGRVLLSSRARTETLGAAAAAPRIALVAVVLAIIAVIL
jgi:hypothetical protein